MAARVWRLKAASLLFAGSLAVHELRYLAGYGAGSGRAELTQGHAYLVVLAPAVAAAAVLGLAAWLLRAAAARPATTDSRSVPAFRRLWTGSSALLAALFAVQETVEGLASPAHPADLTGLVGHGGWTAAVFAVAVGAVVALALRAGDVSVAPGGGTSLLPRLHPAPPSFLFPTSVAAARPRPLARFLAGRGPPPTSA